MITPPAQINGIGPSTMKRREGICRDNNVSSSSKGKEEACMSSCSQIRRGGGPLSTGVLLGSFPWPPRSYSCSFCKREFKSAQALGGHMNVHRRDKARLRHYSPPPCDLLNSNPNPNPSPANGTNKTVAYGIPPLIPNLNMPPPSSACCSWDEENLVASSHSATTLSSSMDAVKALSGGGEWKDYLMERDKAAKGYLLNERKLVRLDMEVACHGLDLELRLGYMFN